MDITRIEPFQMEILPGHELPDVRNKPVLDRGAQQVTEDIDRYNANFDGCEARRAESLEKVECLKIALIIAVVVTVIFLVVFIVLLTLMLSIPLGLLLIPVIGFVITLICSIAIGTAMNIAGLDAEHQEQRRQMFVRPLFVRLNADIASLRSAIEGHNGKVREVNALMQASGDVPV